MKTERRNITQPPDHWAAFAAQADSEGMTLSEWSGACCIANLPPDVAAGLSERPGMGRPKKASS